jgi:translin
VRAWGDELAQLGHDARARLEEAHRAREEALARCRDTIRACGLAIRSVHRREPSATAQRRAEAQGALRRAQEVLAPFPSLAAAGFLHDAEKEYAEACLTEAFVCDAELPGPTQLEVGLAAWLNGMAEAASELRRHLLDRLRAGETQRAEELLGVMEEAYDLLQTIEYPDALTGGLRRSVDGLRAVVERSRADVTTTVLQTRLQRAIESAMHRG